MTSVEEIKKIKEMRYTAEDGAMRLDERDSRAAVGDQEKESVWADNAVVLMASYCLMLWYLDALDDVDADSTHSFLLATRYKPGSFLRTPNRRGVNGAIEFRNSFDNYVSTAVLSKLFSLPFHKEIFQIGVFTGWRFGGYVRMQNKDHGLITIFSGFVPTFVDKLWMNLGFVFNAFQSIHNSSSWQMNFIRVMSLEVAKKQTIAGKFWLEVLRLRGGLERVFRIWYRDGGHPNVMLAKLFDEKRNRSE